MPTEDDPLTHKPGEGPSVTELTGEDSEGEGKGVEPMETGAGPKVEESAEVTTNQKEVRSALLTLKAFDQILYAPITPHWKVLRS